MTHTVAWHSLSDFIDDSVLLNETAPTYWYEGVCPRSGNLVRLPRTPLIEAIAQGVMRNLATHDRYVQEGKMYGVLLVETPSGEQRIIKAFSGLLQGKHTVDGWVPPIPGRDRVAIAEAHTLARLDAIKQTLIALQQLPERQHYVTTIEAFERRLQEQSLVHRQRKEARQHQRQQYLKTLSDNELAIALEQLDDQSRRDGIERRRLKRERDEVLRSLKPIIEHADARISELKRQRKQLSQQLQAQMHAAYWLTNFSGESLSLRQLMPGGSMPTGTGDCCAPKLLHYAATHQLTPLAMAEFWWGLASTTGDKIPGEFYGACAERCQPLMGFLLSGFSQQVELNHSIAKVPLIEEKECIIVYQDEWLIAVDKPAGLLSVPGRYHDRQDCVLNRLRYQLPDGMSLIPVHRLDQDTSGILLLARDPQTYRYLSQQFQQRQIQKLYEAILNGIVTLEHGVIDLPLWGDPDDRPRQRVEWQRGKPSTTYFKVIGQEGNYTRLEFMPVTGRTHQLRVHAADPAGLNAPILGDRLYGCGNSTDRLHLHAREIRFDHPSLGQIHLKSATPF